MARQSGFSLIEVVIAVLIIFTALLSLSALLAFHANQSQYARKQELAKQVGSMIMETIIAAKESSRNGFGFDDLDYTTSQPPGVFPVPTGAANSAVGAQLFYQPGPDGIYGTSDDVPPFVKLAVHPGPDGVYNTADDITMDLSDFTYKIYIDKPNPLDPDTKEVTVYVYYTTPFHSINYITVVCRLTNYNAL